MAILTDYPVGSTKHKVPVPPWTDKVRDMTMTEFKEFWSSRGINHGTVWGLATGRGEPGLRTAVAIAKALELDVESAWIAPPAKPAKRVKSKPLNVAKTVSESIENERNVVDELGAQPAAKADLLTRAMPEGAAEAV